jgi:hypothetical protein
MATQTRKRRRLGAVTGAVVVTVALMVWLIGGAPTDAGVSSVVVKIDPATQFVIAGNPFSVNIAVENVTELGADQATVSFDPQAIQVSQVTEGDFLKSAGPTIGVESIDNVNGAITFSYALMTPGIGVGGSGTLATINFTTNLSANATFVVTLSNVLLSNGTGSPVPIADVVNGTVTLSAPPRVLFDTGSGTYPSISGIFNGTVVPNQTITVNRLYTYPCPGTGGHTEYAEMRNSTGWNVTATWTGYESDWHNISFDTPFTIYANETYNYTIRTGSYPQIIHKTPLNVTGGTITCTSFEDANGNIHTDWIPAIKLL